MSPEPAQPVDYEAVDYVLCGVEGCPRATPEGQDQWCGLARLFGVLDGPRPSFCGAVATVALWEEQGVFL